MSLFSYSEFLKKDINFMINAYDVYKLLEMISEGAAGQTYEELKTLLDLKEPQKNKDFHQFITDVNE